MGESGLAAGHRDALLLASVAGGALPSVADLWCALCVQPVNKLTDTGSTIVEVAYQSYARAQVPCDGQHWNAPDVTGRITNAVAVTFPTPVSAPAGMMAVWFALLDAATGGNLRWSGPIPSLMVSPGDPIILPPGVLACGID